MAGRNYMIFKDPSPQIYDSMKNFTPTCSIQGITPENFAFGELRWQLLWWNVKYYFVASAEMGQWPSTIASLLSWRCLLSQMQQAVAQIRGDYSFFFPQSLLVMGNLRTRIQLRQRPRAPINFRGVHGETVVRPSWKSPALV